MFEAMDNGRIDTPHVQKHAHAHTRTHTHLLHSLLSVDQHDIICSNQSEWTGVDGVFPSRQPLSAVRPHSTLY